VQFNSEFTAYGDQPEHPPLYGSQDNKPGPAPFNVQHADP
jgi:hypothetical protein